MTDWLTTGICLSVCLVCLPSNQSTHLPQWTANHPTPCCSFPWTNIYLAAPQVPGIMFCCHKHNIPPQNQILNQSNTVYSLLLYSTLWYYIIYLSYLSGYISLNFYNLYASLREGLWIQEAVCRPNIGNVFKMSTLPSVFVYSQKQLPLVQHTWENKNVQATFM